MGERYREMFPIVIPRLRAILHGATLVFTPYFTWRKHCVMDAAIRAAAPW